MLALLACFLFGNLKPCGVTWRGGHLAKSIWRTKNEAYYSVNYNYKQ